MKTPEELAEECAELMSPSDEMKSVRRMSFLAGYEAAQRDYAKRNRKIKNAWMEAYARLTSEAK